MTSIDSLSRADLDLIYREFRDHASFCRSSLVVETEAQQIVAMELSPGQLRLNAAIKKQRAKGVPVRLIYLKSRRIQATTGTAAQFFQSTAFQAGVHTAVLAHSDVSTQEIYKIYKRFWSGYRPFAGVIKLPASKARPDKLVFEYAGDPESSYIQVQTAGSVDFGRGFRLTNVHFSEFPYYQRAAELLTAVMAGVPKLPDTTVVIEGTAKTIGDLFNRMWQAAVDPSVESEWVGLFMGWWEHPANRMPLVVSPDKFQNSLTPEELVLAGQYNLSLEQVAWRRWTIRNDCMGDVVRFRREHPATPEDAFTASSRNRFSVPHIQRMPIQREPLVGELQIDPVGVENRLVFLPGDRGALRVWKRPEKGRLYACGADCAQGLDVSPGDGQADPAEEANNRILADRQQRLDDAKAIETLSTDLGLYLKDPEPQADNAADFLSEEWDRKTFGDAIPTYTRTVYGPDPLLISCPAMKASIESIGLESYANATAEAILLKEENAVADPIMQKGLRAAIARFGKDQVATAFRNRILSIPQRTVEVEADRTDAMIFAKPMEEAVMKYGSPGMAPKFLSERCIDVLGMRGYVIVKDEKGDPVKVGTLIMGEIPLRMAEARRRHYAEESNTQVREAAEAFEETAARAVRDGGRSGISVLSQGDRVRSNAAGDFADQELTASYLGQDRETGFRVERQK